MNITDTTTNMGHAIKVELIPEHTRRDIGQVALEGVLRYKRWLDKHPEEKRRFEERAAEIDKRYSARSRK